MMLGIYSQSGVRIETKLILAVLLIVIVYFVLPVPSIAQSAQIAPDKRARLEAVIARFMAANSTPGVSVAVVENGV